ncbi:hypothetical protein RG47T_4861 [Mucilaginibacter polytrichastri]|uniref:Uncharacterized protein n=1 Tax=Mucilaginibacter polytrichastri TaxID=1302689 RepID=A0A1Q6A5T7_9SPHI|nr:hypothetical protein RG47T_4861 [Mucilaginibacter polytrichastri]
MAVMLLAVKYACIVASSVLACAAAVAAVAASVASDELFLQDEMPITANKIKVGIFSCVVFLCVWGSKCYTPVTTFNM